MRRSTRSGFTLIELMIVVGILGILVAVLTGFLLNAAAKGDESRAKDFVRQAIPAAMTRWQEEHKKNNAYPPSPNLVDGSAYVDGNISLYEALVTEPQAKGQDAYISSDLYIAGDAKGKKIFLDPWNNPYIYRNYTMKRTTSGTARPFNGKRYNENTYDIISMGPDGQLYEVEGKNDDIHNGLE